MISAYSLTGDRIISILDVREGRIASDAKFVCPHCRTPMHTAIGKVQRPHFRHRDLSIAQAHGCSPEGILHSTAKMLVAERVATATISGQPYLLRLAETISCAHRKKVLAGTCKHRNAQRTMDLACFTAIKLEVPRDSFRYDLLLEAEGLIPLAIEIVVSSPATAAKKAGKIPIIEIKIENEEDIAKLMHGIDDHNLLVDSYGMEAHLGPPSESCAGPDCASACLSFSVMTNGSVRLDELLPHEASRARAGRAHQVVVASRQAFSLSRFEALDRLTRQAYYCEHVPVRSCLICRHHHIADFTGSGEGPVACNQDGKRGSINRGVGCLYFTPFASISEARQHRLEGRSDDVIER